MQSAHLCVIIHVKQLPFLAVLTWFLILGKIQDGDHYRRRHRPPAAPPFVKYTSSLLRRSKAFQRRQNRFEILQHIKNSEEGQWRIQGRAPLIFRPKWGPKGWKKFFCRPGPPLSQGLDDRPPPPLIWRESGSATEGFHLPSSCTMVGDIKVVVGFVWDYTFSLKLLL